MSVHSTLPEHDSVQSFPVLMRLPDVREPAVHSPPARPAAQPDGPTRPATGSPSVDVIATKPNNPPPTAAPSAAVAATTNQPTTTTVPASTAVASHTETSAAASPVLSAPVDEEKKPVSIAVSADTAAEPFDHRPDASASTQPEPATAARRHDARALRRQRALQRDRPQPETEAKPNWWTSQLPVILVGFVCALLVTVYVARMNRTRPTPDQWVGNEELPELNIETGASTSQPPGMLAPALQEESSPAKKLATASSPASGTAKPATSNPATSETLSATSAGPAMSLSTPPLLSSGSAVKTDAPPSLHPASGETAAKSAQAADSDYPTTGAPALSPETRVAKQPATETTDPAYPTTNFPPLYR